MVDIIKNLYCRKVFNKEIEFTIIQLAHRLSQVAYCIMFVCDDTYYTFFGLPWVYSKLTNSRGPPPPPPLPNTPLNVIMFAA